MLKVTIRQKMIAGITALVIVTTGTLSFFYTVSQKKLVIDNLVTKSLYIANNLANNAEYYILTANSVALDSIVEKAVSETDVAYCIVFDGNGKVMEDASAEGGRYPPGAQNLLDMTTAPEARLQGLKRRLGSFGGTYYEADAPVMTVRSSPDQDALGILVVSNGGARRERIGTVRLGVSSAASEARIRQSQETTALLALLIILIANLATIVMSGVMLRPLDNLMKGTREIAAGNLEYRVRAFTKDEFEDLARSFDTMAERLNKTMVSVGMLNKEIGERQSAEKKLEAAYLELQKTHAQLMQAEKLEAVGRLASGLAHEVRNPLGILLQGADYLQSKLPRDDKDLPGIVDMMRQNIKRADNIIRTLVDFSRAGELHIRPENPNAIVESSLLLIQHLVRLEGVRIDKVLEGSLPRVMVDKGRAEQVLVNIFTNAVQAMSQGGVLTVRTYMARFGDKAGKGSVYADYHLGTDDEAVAVETEDTGTGISAEDLQKVFEPFFTTKEPGKGTGLGLSVTRNIIELHNGAIRLVSRPGHGTVVTVLFRVSKAAR